MYGKALKKGQDRRQSELTEQIQEICSRQQSSDNLTMTDNKFF